MSDSQTTILLFDDDPDQRKQLAAELSDAETKIVTPESRYDVLPTVTAAPGRFAFILLDHHFQTAEPGCVLDGERPVINTGMDLSRLIFQVAPTIPIVLYTSEIRVAPEWPEAARAGVYRVIEQPQLRELARELRALLREVRDIERRLGHLQETRRNVSHVVASLGVGFQVVDRYGRVWFHDAEFDRISGESGRPYQLCYCRSHGYRIEHGMCRSCLLRRLREGRQDFQIFYSPTYAGGRGREPVFKYLSVRGTPILRKREPENGPDGSADLPTAEPIAMIEAVSEITSSCVIESMGLIDHLDILARSLQDIGFRRVRIYRAVRHLEHGVLRPAIRGLTFHGPVERGLHAQDVSVVMEREPRPDEGRGTAMARLVDGETYITHTEELDRRLQILPEHRPLAVVLFSAQGEFIGWVALDNAAFLSEAGAADGGIAEPATAADLFPEPDDECVPPSAMTVMEEIARVMASKPATPDVPPADHLQAERVFESIRMRIATDIQVGPAQLLKFILETVQREIPQVEMAHVRRLDDDSAMSVAHIGKYGDIAEPRVNVQRSRRMTAQVARTRIPEFLDDLKCTDTDIQGYDEFSPAQRDVITAYASHAVYPLTSEGETIGTVSFQVKEPGFFRGYRRQLFQMIAGLLAGGLRDYLAYQRDVQAIAADVGRRAAVLLIHNTNQPLSIMRMRLQMAREDLAEALTRDTGALSDCLRDLDRQLQEIDHQCLRIADIRSDAAFLARQAPGALESAKAHALICAVAGEAMQTEPHLAIAYQLAPELAAIRTFPRVLQVVLRVLVRNAAEALAGKPSEKKLTLILRSANANLPEEARFQNCLAVDVIDNGPGVTAEGVARLFQPFESSKEGGMGIGLVHARQLSRVVGGETYYCGTDPRGTRFTILLPVQQDWSLTKGDSP